MANVIPFKGLKFNTNKVKLADIVSLPYDKLDKDLLASFSAKSPYNIAPLIQGDFLRENRDDDSWYDGVNNKIKDWIKKEVLVLSDKPSIYIYEQTYLQNGKHLSRISFSALCELEPFNSGRIKPHENTFSGPKSDRKKLLKSTHINFGHIFMLFFGKENSIRELLMEKASTEQPLCDFLDDFEIRHRFWEVSDEPFINNITSQMKKQDLLIADGHHRYETALEFYQYMKEQDPENGEKFKYRMMTFVDINDPALVILPTHRVFYSEKEITAEKWQKIVEKLKESFTISDAIEEKKGDQLKKELEKESPLPSFLIVKDNTVKKIELKKDVFDQIKEEDKKLSVSVLQNFIARDIFNKDFSSMVPGKDVDYFKNYESLLEAVKSDPRSVGFLLNPTPIEQVKTVVESGARMPQKSTDFFPKIYTGLVMNKID